MSCTSAPRAPRNETTDAYLQALQPTEAQLKTMQAARSEFGQWHGISLILNFAVILCVTGAMVLAAHLPTEPTPPPAPSRDAATPVPESVAGS